MEDKTASALFEELKENVSKYANDTIQLVKLQVFEKIGIGSGKTAYNILLIFFVLFALSLILITVGFYLGELFRSNWIGFGIVSVVTLLLLFILLLSKKSITKSITNKIIEFLMEDENKKKEEK
jgi:membrane-bound ClpP family serine protease